MPVAIPGLTALRRHLFGRQTDFGVANTASRAYPFGGTPDINLNWTDPEGDFGSLDPVAPPFRGSADLSASLTDNSVAYNNLPLILGSILGGDVEPSGGAAKTWAFTPTSLTAGDLDLFSYQFGDDVNGLGGLPADWFLMYDGLTESVSFTFPRGLGPVTAQMTWRFGSVRYDGATESDLQPPFTIPTGGATGLVIDSAAVPVYLGDAKLYIDSTFAGIGSTQVSDAMYGGQLTISRELDQKRYANGTGFDIAGYSSGKRTIEFQGDFAKTADIVGVGSESDAWFSDTAINRFVRLAFTSTKEATTGTAYSWVINMPLRYYTRSEDAEGGNSLVSLTGHQFYSSDATYAISSTVVNTLGLSDLETAAS